MDRQLRFFVTAIGTDSGKTVVSAILCEALGADYWKPVQAGLPADSDVVRNLVTPERTTIHHEAYRLNTPASPHAAARLDGVEIRIADMIVPETRKPLVIEGAGGCLVPLNDRDFVIDIASRIDAKLIVVSNFYLGSINHTLLSLEAIKTRGLSVAGIIFNGPHNEESERIIMTHYPDIPRILHVNVEKSITSETIRKYADQIAIDKLLRVD